VIDCARKHGIDISTEMYPCTASASRIESVIYDGDWPYRRRELSRPAVGAHGRAADGGDPREYRKQGGAVIAHHPSRGPDAPPQESHDDVRQRRPTGEQARAPAQRRHSFPRRMTLMPAERCNRRCRLWETKAASKRAPTRHHGFRSGSRDRPHDV
jgi:hypothetical protein